MDEGPGGRTGRTGRRVRRSAGGARDRARGIALLAVVLVVVIAWLATVSHPGASYAPLANMVSDLGRVTCVTWDDRPICSPRHPVFNTAFVGCGVVVALVAVSVRRRWGTPLTLAITGLGLGLILLGAFPSDVAKPPHLAGAVLALPVPGAGLLSSGARPDRPWLLPYRRLRAWLGAVCLAVSAGHLLPADVPFPRGPAEYVGIVAILVFLVVEGVRLTRIRPAVVER